jgi:pyridoxal phosphate enzyme (YggS family)
MNVAAHLAEVRAQIAAACERCGRDPATVDLLAVSKARSAEAVRAARQAGQGEFGENRVQELVAKARELQKADVTWHMVGSLQTNKVRDLLDVRSLVLLHSLDRTKLADHLQSALEERSRHLPVLLQVNATDEVRKRGIPSEGAGELARHVVHDCSRLSLVGLMAMGPRRGDAAPAFERVARLRGGLQDRFGLALPVLSLGMTGDLEAAIAAGSTLVRVGTGIFGPRPSA